MKITINNQTYSIEARLKRVSIRRMKYKQMVLFKKFSHIDYSNSTVEEKFIEIECIISTEHISVSIPYIVKQYIKVRSEFSRKEIDIDTTKIINAIFDYSQEMCDFFQEKFINIQLFEIECDNVVISDIYEIICMMESVKNVKITKELYEMTDTDCFFIGFDPKSILNGKYVIIEYSKYIFNEYIRGKAFYDSLSLVSIGYWSLPIYDYNRVHLNFSLETDEYIYMIVPENFKFSYSSFTIKAHRIDMKLNSMPRISRFRKLSAHMIDKLDSMPRTYSGYEYVFKGSFQQCYNILNSDIELNKYTIPIRAREEEDEYYSRIRREEDDALSNNYYDYKRDTFDALTDGNGDYDEWREHGGDLDSLMTNLGYD